MPEICRFLGIVIAMYHGDHSPPHFRFRYAGHRARIALEPLGVMAGELPPRLMGLVMEWASRHRIDWPNGADVDPSVLYAWAIGVGG